MNKHISVLALLSLLCFHAPGLAFGEGQNDTIPSLIKKLKSNDSLVQEYAAEKLGELKDSRAIEPLIDVIRDKTKTYKSSTRMDTADLGIVFQQLLMNPESNEADMRVMRKTLRALTNIGVPSLDPYFSAVKDKNLYVRLLVLGVLANINDPRVVEPLTIALNDDNWPIRGMAARALGELKAPGSIPALRKAIRDKQPEVRKEAEHALSQIRDPRAMDQYIDMLHDKETSVRLMAITRLGELKDPRTISSLSALMEDSSVEVRKLTVLALVHIKNPQIIRPILKAWQDKSFAVRRTATSSAFLITVVDPQAFDELLTVARNTTDHEVRNEAVRLLGIYKDPRAIPFLMQLNLKDNDYLRLEAVNALGQIGRPSVAPLLRALQNRNTASWAAAALIKTNDPEALNAALKFIGDNSVPASDKKCAIDLMKGVRDPRAVDVLLGVYKKEHELRGAIAIFFGEMKDSRTVDVLVEGLKDRTWDGRDVAARSLGEIGDRRAVPGLMTALKEDDPNLRIQALRALGHLQDPRAVPAIVDCMERTEARRESWHNPIRQEGFSALVRIGQNSIPALNRLMKSTNEDLRKEAGYSLHNIQTKKP